MKYISTLLGLMAMILTTSCGGDSGEKDVTHLFNETLRANEMLDLHDDGSITYIAVQWGGIAARMTDDGEPVNWSAYKKIVFEFSEPVNVGTQILINNKIMAWGSPGITHLECSLEGFESEPIERLAMQTTKETRVEVKRIYLSMESVPNSQVALWYGECIFDEWTNGMFIAPYLFNNAIEGDKLELIYTVDDTDDPNITYWQYKAVYCDTDSTLERNIPRQNDWGCIDVKKNSTKDIVSLTATDVRMLQKYGLFINGYHLTMRQVNLLTE